MLKPFSLRFKSGHMPLRPVRFSGDQVITSGTIPDVPQRSDCVLYFPAGLTLVFRSSRAAQGSRKMSIADSRKLIAGGLGVSPRNVLTWNAPEGFWWFVSPPGWEAVNQSLPVFLGLPAFIRPMGAIATDPLGVYGYLFPVMAEGNPDSVSGFVVILQSGGVMESNVISMATVSNPQSFLLGISSFLDHLLQTISQEEGPAPKEEISWIRDSRNRTALDWNQVAGTIQDIPFDLLGDALKDPPFVHESLSAKNASWRSIFLKVLPGSLLGMLLFLIALFFVRHFDHLAIERTRILKARHELLLARLTNARMVHILLSDVNADLSSQMDLSWGLTRLDIASSPLTSRELILFRAGAAKYNWFIEGRAPSRILLDTLVGRTKERIAAQHLLLTNPRPIYLPVEDLSPSFLFQGQWNGLLRKEEEGK